MNKRRLARAYAFQAVYAASFNETNTVHTLEENQQLGKREMSFARSIIEGVLGNVSLLDATLQPFSPKRKMERFPKVELAILRMAAWELLHPSEDTPAGVIINEAILLAKEYGDEGSYKYINGILHNLSRARGE